jgi:hypothetical protein
MPLSLCYVLGVRADGEINDAILRSAAELSMSAVRRLCLVSSFLGLTTHQVAAFRYDGG